jgi:hypothetical protein
MRTWSLVTAVLLLLAATALAAQVSDPWSSAEQMQKVAGPHMLKTDVGDFERGFGFGQETSRERLAFRLGALRVHYAVAAMSRDGKRQREVVALVNAALEELGGAGGGPVAPGPEAGAAIGRALEPLAADRQLASYLAFGDWVERLQIMLAVRPATGAEAFDQSIRDYLAAREAMAALAGSMGLEPALVEKTRQVVALKDSQAFSAEGLQMAAKNISDIRAQLI